MKSSPFTPHSTGCVVKFIWDIFQFENRFSLMSGMEINTWQLSLTQFSNGSWVTYNEWARKKKRFNESMQRCFLKSEMCIRKSTYTDRRRLLSVRRGGSCQRRRLRLGYHYCNSSSSFVKSSRLHVTVRLYAHYREVTQKNSIWNNSFVCCVSFCISVLQYTIWGC